MGGGTANGALAGAVSAAGGLGTVGIVLEPRRMYEEIAHARALAPGRPVAANLLLPFTRRAHAEACIAAGVDCVVLFCGQRPGLVRRLHEAGVLVLQQVGTPAQARRALDDGVDGLIGQGRQAGGHLLGVQPASELLVALLELAPRRPVLLAGGIADAEDVRGAVALGAAAVVCGTRFLLTEECAAHPAYKRRVLGAAETIETRLFSVGWYERHRVAPNAITRRWTSTRTAGPRAVLALNRLTAPLLRRLPPSVAERTLGAQRVSVPFCGPVSILSGMDERLVDVTPLYAGVSAARIGEIIPAGQAVRELAGV